MPRRRSIPFHTPFISWHELELTDGTPHWSDEYRVSSPRLLVPRDRGGRCCPRAGRSAWHAPGGRTGLWPRGLPRAQLAVMVCGAGLPFGLVAMNGTRPAPSAHMGVLIAGASPLIAAAIAWAVWRQRPDRRQCTGLAPMALGVAALLGFKRFSGRTGAVAWAGDALFLLAATRWACFTLSFRRSGLTPWQGASLVYAW